ncbi:twin-arginine translocation signal domain-containing protein [Vibrio chagasii]|nr:twin-arginine translocation signal domain-containing protein [Vibrio chagasii]
MSLDRRQFLKAALTATAASALPVSWCLLLIARGRFRGHGYPMR